MWYAPHLQQHAMVTSAIPALSACSGIDFKKSFDEQIAKMRAFMQQHGLTEGADPGAARAPAGIPYTYRCCRC